MPEPVISSEEKRVAKHSTCKLAYSLPVLVTEDDSRVKVTVYHGEQPLDSFVVEANQQNNTTIIETVLNEVDNVDEGLYTISAEYKRQKFIHKISLSISK